MGPYGIKENVKTKNPKEDKLEPERCISSLPITVEKIELETEDPPAKCTSKKSKRKDQLESEEIPETFPVPVENIKLKKNDSPSLTILSSKKSKSKKKRLEAVQMEVSSPLPALPITVEKIKLELEDNPSKHSSRKSKIINLLEEPQDISALFPIPVGNIKWEKRDPHSKKSEKLKQEEDDVVELPKPLPGPVQIIKLEQEEDPPTKIISKKSKRIRLEQERQESESHSILPVPIEKIKLEEDDPPSKKSKKIVDESDHLLELPSTLPVLIDKIKLEKDDPPSKSSSKKSKKNKLVPEEISSPLPIPVENIKLEKEDRPSKKSKKIAHESDHLSDIPSTLPLPIEKIKSEEEDYPSSSKKSKRNKSEFDPDEVPPPLPIPAQNIKLEEEDLGEIVYMRFTPAPESIKVEKEDDVAETETAVSEKRSKKRKNKSSNETQPAGLDSDNSESKTQILFPCQFKGGSCDVAFWTAENLERHLENVHSQCKVLEPVKWIIRCIIPECLKFVPYLQMNRHLEIEHSEEFGRMSRNEKGEEENRQTIRKRGTQLDVDVKSKTGTLFHCWYSSCCVEFSTAEALDTHMRKVHCVIQCEILECGKYIPPSEMKKHMKKKHGVPCIICNKKFPSQPSFDQHSRDVHAETKEYTCKVCQQTYQSKIQDEVVATRNHLISKCPVPGAESFPCKNCQFVASTKKEKIDHDCQPKERRVKCFYPHCGDLFANLGELNIHRSTVNHWMNIRHTCFCKLQFPTMEALKTHRDSEHLLGCNFGHCTKTFLKRQGLESHVKMVHGGILIPLVYSCKLCEIPFKNKTSLEDHMVMAHDDDKK